MNTGRRNFRRSESECLQCETQLSVSSPCGCWRDAVFSRSEWASISFRLRPTVLPEDERFIGLSLDALSQISSSLPVWLDRVFVVLGGHIIATGLLIVLAAILLWDHRGNLPTALALIVAAGLASVALMSAVNFAIHSPRSPCSGSKKIRPEHHDFRNRLLDRTGYPGTPKSYGRKLVTACRGKAAYRGGA